MFTSANKTKQTKKQKQNVKRLGNGVKERPSVLLTNSRHEIPDAESRTGVTP